MCGWLYKMFNGCRSNGGSSNVGSATESRRNGLVDISLTQVDTDQVPKAETGQVLVVVPPSNPAGYHHQTTMTASASTSQIAPLAATSGPTARSGPVTRRSAW